MSPPTHSPLTLRKRRRLDRAITVALAAAAVTVLVVTGAIVAFVGKAGIAGFVQSGFAPMLLGRQWAPSQQPPVTGFLPFLFGTFATAIGGVTLGAPPAVLAAIYLSELGSSRLHRVLRYVMQVTASVPSVVFGYVAMSYLVPALGDPATGCHGFGIAAATIVLAAMIAPTVTLLSLDALARTPAGLRDASDALGVSRWQTTWRAVVPATWPGLLTAVFLGFARAAGETMAVQMVAGNGRLAPLAALRPPDAHTAAGACTSVAGLDLFRPMSTIATRIVTDMPHAEPGTPWSNALFSMSLVLLVLSTVIVLATRWLAHRVAS